MNAYELITAINQGVDLGTSTINKATTLAAFIVASAVTKFFLVTVLLFVVYKIAKVWLARLFPDKGKFDLARDSLYSSVMVLIGIAAWRFF